jgi:hypothetical protein
MLGEERMAKLKHEKLEFAYLPLHLIDVSLLNVRKSNLNKGIEEGSDPESCTNLS